MITLFFVFVGLIIIHYVYDRILLPSFRWEIRLDLFNLRDQLRILKINKMDSFSDDYFHFGEDSINIAIDNIYRIDFSMIIKSFKLLRNDGDYRKFVDKRIEFLHLCDNQEFKDIMKRHERLFAKTLIVNNFLLILFCLPFFTIFFVGSLIYKIIHKSFHWKDKFKKTVMSPSIIPNTNFEKYYGAPDREFAFNC